MMNLFADPRITKIIEDTQAPSIDKRELDVLATVNTEPIQKIIKHEEPTMPTMPDFNLDALHAINQLERELAQLEKKAKGKAKPVDDEDENDNGDDTDTGADDNTEDDWSEHADAERNKKKVAKRHKFEAMTDKISREDGVSTTEAMSRARKLYPDLHASFQQYNPANPDAYSPRMNAQKSYRTLVNEEIAKGCSPVVAGQRVMQLHGIGANSNGRITKADNAMAEFNDLVSEYQAIHGCDRLTAMTATRKRYAEHPALQPTGNDGARRIQR
jgi:hypothetical protein